MRIDNHILSLKLRTSLNKDKLATVLSPYFCTRHPIPTNNVAPFSEYKTHIQPTIPPIALM